MPRNKYIGTKDMLVSGTMTEAPLRHFERAWDDPDILKHTWKRFTKMAKEFLRKE